jgi:HemY protein
MRSVVWLILLFVVAVVAATTLGANDGLVSIFWAGWRTDLSLNLFLLLLLAAVGVVVVVAQALASLLSMPRRAGEWRAQRRERAAHIALREAVAEFFAARYTRAHKAAQRVLALQQDHPELRGDADLALVARLLAAGSLHRLQDRARRDREVEAALQLRTAHRSGEEGARLLAAEWALDDRDGERTLDLLAALPPGVARRTQALRLRMLAARLVRRPTEALATARLLANHQAFSPAAAQGLLRSLAFEAIEATRDLQQLQRLWDEFDAADRRDPHVVARAANHAVRLGDAAVALGWLRASWDRIGDLSRDERDEVALAVAGAAGAAGADWLSRVEGAGVAQGHESAVVAATGAVYAARGLWGKARAPLERTATSADLPPAVRRRAWRQLAALAAEQGDSARERECERAAAALD